MFENNYCGVYLITSRVTGRMYVGSAANMPFRKERHLKSLRAGTHHNKLLQGIFNQHGEGDLDFSVIQVCATRAEAYAIEAREMERLASSPSLLNIGKHARGGDNLTRHPNRLDVIQRTSETLRRRIADLSTAVRQQTYARKGSSNGMAGRAHTDEAKQKISASAAGNKRSAGRVMRQDQRDRLSELAQARTQERNGFYGRQHSEETKQRISAARRASPVLPASRQPLTVDGRNFESIQAAMSALGLSRHIIKRRLADPAFPTYRRKKT